MPTLPKYQPVPKDIPLPANAPVCDLCRRPAFELRPFGPHGESVCEPCSHYSPGMAESYHIPIPGMAAPDASEPFLHSHGQHSHGPDTHSHGDG
jgi:hypothetical protein